MRHNDSKPNESILSTMIKTTSNFSTTLGVEFSLYKGCFDMEAHCCRGSLQMESHCCTESASTWKLTAAEGRLPHGSHGTNCKLTSPDIEEIIWL